VAKEEDHRDQEQAKDRIGEKIGRGGGYRAKKQGIQRKFSFRNEITAW